MRTRLSLLVGTALVAVFSAGWAFGSTEVANRVNSGLVNAMNSVGQNLFGTEIFAAGIVNPDFLPFPGDIPTVQLDIGEASEVPVVLNLFHPPDPNARICQASVQVVISPTEATRFIVNEAAFPMGSALPVFEIATPVAAPPNPCTNDTIIIESPG